jgi:hypothetical protein
LLQKRNLSTVLPPQQRQLLQGLPRHPQLMQLFPAQSFAGGEQRAGGTGGTGEGAVARMPRRSGHIRGQPELMRLLPTQSFPPSKEQRAGGAGGTGEGAVVALQPRCSGH